MFFRDTHSNFYSSTLIDNAMVHHGFGTKSSVNLKNIYPDTINIIYLNQTHGNTIVMVDTYQKNLEQVFDSADGIITNLSNIIVCIKTADCVPIIFVDVDNHLIGISHQGYKGTLLGLSEKMVNTLETYGSNISRLKVLIGPAICDTCYPVTGKRLEDFKKIFNIHDNIIDLKDLNMKLLITSGVSPENIDVSPLCTSCNPDLFYSYRRDGTHTSLMNFVSINSV
jgi:YfiH family protein